MRGMKKNPDRMAPALKSYISALGLRQADLAEIWGVGRIQVGRIVNCQSGFGSNHAKALCRYAGFPEEDFSRLYGVPADIFYFARHGVTWKGQKPPGNLSLPPSQLSLRRVPVVGFVQAGFFTEAIEWGFEDRYYVQIPTDDGYPPDLTRYGLEVRGNSMNRIFPDGSLVSVIDFSELGRAPETGDYVTVLRRDDFGPGMEATVKALQIRDDGSICLWPRSTDPHFQQPFVIPPPNTDYYDQAGCPDIEIKGLVVGSIKTRLKATF